MGMSRGLTRWPFGFLGRRWSRTFFFGFLGVVLMLYVVDRAVADFEHIRIVGDIVIAGYLLF